MLNSMLSLKKQWKGLTNMREINFYMHFYRIFAIFYANFTNI